VFVLIPPRAGVRADSSQRVRVCANRVCVLVADSPSSRVCCLVTRCRCRPRVSKKTGGADDCDADVEQSGDESNKERALPEVGWRSLLALGHRTLVLGRRLGRGGLDRLQ